MGYSNLITKAVSEVTNDILKNKDATVCELGNQTLKNSKSRSEIYSKLGISQPKELSSTKDFYLSLGFSKYIAIDVNTERDAIAMDLNLDIVKEYNFKEQYDLVTNNGTGEHIFNQYMVFKNSHNLCKVGGYMIHVLPFYRWVDHGFFNYNPNLFPCLANQNNYDLIELWIGTSDTVNLEKLDPKNLSRNKGYRHSFNLDSWESDPMIAAILKKNNNFNFEIPIQFLYGGDNISDENISEKYK